MGKPSIKECVGNVVRIKSNKEGVQSIIETEGEETKRKMSYADIVLGKHMVRQKDINMPYPSIRK